MSYVKKNVCLRNTFKSFHSLKERGVVCKITNNMSHRSSTFCFLIEIKSAYQLACRFFSWPHVKLDFFFLKPMNVWTNLMIPSFAAATDQYITMYQSVWCFGIQHKITYVMPFSTGLLLHVLYTVSPFYPCSLVSSRSHFSSSPPGSNEVLEPHPPAIFPLLFVLS